MAAGPGPYNRKNPAEQAEKAQVVFQLKLDGHSFRAIEAITAAPDGPTRGERIPWTTARDLLREECAQRVDPKVDEYRTLELARLEAALERLHNMEESVRTVMGRQHITVNNGRVIRTLNPDTGEEEPVEDDTFILQAIDRLNRIEEQRRKTGEAIRRLLGLDAPTKVDAQVTEVTQSDLELQEMLRNAKTKVQLEEQGIIDGGTG